MEAQPTLQLADLSESRNIQRYVRYRRFLTEVADAAKRADATMRLEIVLKRLNDITAQSA